MEDTVRWAKAFESDTRNKQVLNIPTLHGIFNTIPNSSLVQ